MNVCCNLGECCKPFCLEYLLLLLFVVVMKSDCCVSVFYVCNDDDEEEEAQREREREREEVFCRRESTLCVSSWTNHPPLLINDLTIQQLCYYY